MPDRSHLPARHPEIAFGRIGVLLVNLGTPDAPDTSSVRRYLREFLSDRRVIETHPLLWQPILNLFILPFRPRRTAAAYRKIWNDARNESPLRTITRAQSEALGKVLGSSPEGAAVDWAMRYGTPSIRDRLDTLAAAGCDRILLFPLYPQYSATTTATVNDEAFRVLGTMRRQPAIRTVPAYPDHPLYIDALAQSVRARIAEIGWNPEILIASFHGLPQAYFDAGDPYYCHCRKTGRLLAEALDLDAKRFRVTFQSRFGPKAWLKPYTDETLRSLVRDGVEDVMVVTPGFAADCLETLEEIAMGSREIFLDAGGKRFAVVPCLNDSADHIRLLERIVRDELSGWLESARASNDAERNRGPFPGP